MLKFIYSEKATKFCEISTSLLSYVVPVKSKVGISKNIVAFSEYMKISFGLKSTCLKEITIFIEKAARCQKNDNIWTLDWIGPLVCRVFSRLFEAQTGSTKEDTMQPSTPIYRMLT